MRFIPVMEKEDLLNLRPGKGDTVVYDGECYVVEEIGMKYFVVHPVDNPAVKRWLKHQQVYKWVPPRPEEMEDREWKTPLIRRK